MGQKKTPVFFHPDQLLFDAPYEWDVRGQVPHPESPERAEIILEALKGAPDQFDIQEPKEIPEAAIRQIHGTGLLRMYETASKMPEERWFYPTFFPKITQRRADPDNIYHAGFFAFDTSSPLHANTFKSASWSAASAWAAAMAVKDGEKLSYGLCRPPGHHAERNYFGGYSYLNNSAIAAAALRDEGNVVILDIDYHHGDGTQSIFYYISEVFYISMHADPVNHFPYYSGHASEVGLEAGKGYNLNVPLQAGTTGQDFLEALQERVIPAIKEYDPAYLIVSAGLDTYKLDPLGDFLLETSDYEDIGRELGRMHYPTAVLQEGGYHVADLGANMKSLLTGFRQGLNIS